MAVVTEMVTAMVIECVGGGVREVVTQVVTAVEEEVMRSGEKFGARTTSAQHAASASALQTS